MPKLHTKAVFFERSGVLLVGSENIYSPTSAFSEVMLETVIPEAQRQEIVDLIFRRLKGGFLTAKFGVEDIRIHSNRSFAAGRPFLPCHREIPYWDVIGPSPVVGMDIDDRYLPIEARQFHRWIYLVCAYQIAGQRCGLAFDRGYSYCGDLDQPALEWLLENCEILEERKGGGPIEQSDSTIVKDRFYRYHPIAKSHSSVTDYWFGRIKNPNKFSDLHENFDDA